MRGGRNLEPPQVGSPDAHHFKPLPFPPHVKSRIGVLGLLQNVVIADAKHVQVLLLSEKRLALVILFPAIIVTSPIDLDDEGGLVAEEIHDIGTDRLLATEFQAGEASAT